MANDAHKTRNNKFLKSQFENEIKTSLQYMCVMSYNLIPVSIYVFYAYIHTIKHQIGAVVNFRVSLNV